MVNDLLKPARPAFPAGLSWMGVDYDQMLKGILKGNWPVAWPGLLWSEAPKALAAFEHLPHIEVQENDEKFVLTVELPGLDQKDARVSVDGDTLTISGEKRLEHTDEQTHYSERSYGRFERAFRLPDNADRQSISARFSKGVLSIDIAKSAEGRTRGQPVDIKVE